MGEPFKNLFNEELIKDLSGEIKTVYSQFDSSTFFDSVFDKNWKDLELKERMNHIARSLKEFLPDDYGESIEILRSVSFHFSGLGHMIFPAYVEIFGLDSFDISLDALEFFTQYSSSEFAVRPFIIKYPEKMLNKMTLWAQSKNHHVRRLSSEGCRPRLPWAMALPDLKKDPTPIIPILERLKEDESEYVRRSVANNLNDISKDNPHIVMNIAEQWLGVTEDTDKLVKHACRTLLKQGDKQILTLFGYSDPVHLFLADYEVQDSVKMEETLLFSFNLITKDKCLGKLRLEYAVDFMKKNGKLSRKVFKLGESVYSHQEKSFERKHSFKTITTRVYYPGEHRLAIIINGVEMAVKSFFLKIP